MDLEKSMIKQYKYQRLGPHTKGNEEDLLELQEWAEKWIMKKRGKLTITAENEIKQVLDKLRIEQH